VYYNDDKKKIDGKSYRFEQIKANLSYNGIFTISAEILDKQENILYKFETPSYGLNGAFFEKNIRNISYETLIEDLEILKKANSIKIIGIRV